MTEPTSPNRSTAGQRTASRPGRGRVLLVEDDLHERNLLALMLRTNGWSVVEAGTGVELLEWIGIVSSSSQRIFDVVLSDVVMPDLSTLEVLSGWRYGGWSVPFLVVTAHDDPAVHAEARTLGAETVLLKPVQERDLCEALARAVARNDAQAAPPDHASVDGPAAPVRRIGSRSAS